MVLGALGDQWVPRIQLHLAPQGSPETEDRVRPPRRRSDQTRGLLTMVPRIVQNRMHYIPRPIALPRSRPYPLSFLTQLLFLVPPQCPPGTPDSPQGQGDQPDLHFPSNQVHPMKQRFGAIDIRGKVGHFKNRGPGNMQERMGVMKRRQAWRNGSGGDAEGCRATWRWTQLRSHSQLCQGGLSLLGSPSDQQDHPSLGPLGDQGHP